MGLFDVARQAEQMQMSKDANRSRHGMLNDDTPLRRAQYGGMYGSLMQDPADKARMEAQMMEDTMAMMPMAGMATEPNKIGGLLNTIQKRAGRDWSDVRLADRREGLAEKFLEEHGFDYSDIPGKPNTYTYVGDKVKAYSEYVKGGKSGMSVKTFNNPTLKSLRNWMGY